jgi:hypothetical protein
MNMYTMVGSGFGRAEATALSARLATWHDAMVAHERKIRAGRPDAACDEECPHADARALWIEALETFGERAHELTFLRSRATAASEPSEELVAASSDERSGAAYRGPRSTGPGHQATARQSKLFVDSSEQSRTVLVEL